MIHLANECDFNRNITDESELRICSLKRAYGLAVPFIQFFADDDGAIASVMDRVCTLYCASLPSDEWCEFLQMNGNIKVIHTNADIAAFLARRWGISHEKGCVLCRESLLSEKPLHEYNIHDVSLRDIYGVLSKTFCEFPSFDSWYVDASHRHRHGCCHIVTEKQNDQPISVAMTIAETEDMALIGCVATLPEHRGRGAASRCIHQLMGFLKQRRILISPSDAHSEGLYRKLGFLPYGTWGEVSLHETGG